MTKSLDPFRFLLIAVSGWMNQQQLQLIDYLREENRVLHDTSLNRLDCTDHIRSAQDRTIDSLDTTGPEQFQSPPSGSVFDRAVGPAMLKARSVCASTN